MFWVKLFYWLDKLCCLGDLNNECVQQNLLQWHWQMFISSPSIVSTWYPLSPRRSEKWMCRAVFPSDNNSLFMKNFRVTLLYQFMALQLCTPDNACAEALPVSPTWNSAWRHIQWTCRAKSSPVSPVNGIFKTIFWLKLFYWIDELCVSGNLNDECVVFWRFTDK